MVTMPLAAMTLLLVLALALALILVLILVLVLVLVLVEAGAQPVECVNFIVSCLMNDLVASGAQPVECVGEHRLLELVVRDAAVTVRVDGSNERGHLRGRW